MKQKVIILVWFAFFSAYGVFSLLVSAGSYQDDFDVLKEDNWEHWGKYAIWTTENGFLNARIQSPSTSFELFQYIGPGTYEPYEIPIGQDIIQRQTKKPGYEQFTITIENLGVRGANFGIAIGRLFPELDVGSKPFYYLFTTDKIYAVRFNGWSGVFPWLWRKSHNPNTAWETWELEFMEVRYSKGHFQWYVDDEKRADFVDPEFSPIEILGFVLIGEQFPAGHAWVDSFKISWRGFAVLPQAKLTTNWGRLKKQ